MRHLAYIALLLSACGSPSPADLPTVDARPVPRVRSVESARPPNVLIIFADDLGYGDVGAYNPESKIPTPNMDRLADEGLRFTDAHSSSGWCTPSRYSILTGRFHWRAGIYQVRNVWEKSIVDRETFADILVAAGYRTSMFGKWHLGMWPSGERHEWSAPVEGGPTDHGFASFFGADIPYGAPYTWVTDDLAQEPTEPWTEPEPVAVGIDPRRPGPTAPGFSFEVFDAVVSERVAQYVGSSPEPWLAHWTTAAPHIPVLPSERWRGVSDAGPYGDFVAELDAHVGTVLDALDASGRAGRTLVLLTSDNGPEHRWDLAYEIARRYGHRSAGPLRGGKRDLYEGGHRVPFVVRWPGVVEPGTVSDALVSHVDVAATLAELAGGDEPDGDGVSFAPVLSGDAGGRDWIVHNTEEGSFALREGAWLYIDGPTGYSSRAQPPDWYEAAHYITDAQPVELYDLSRDLGQHRNLAASEEARAEQMRQRLEEYTP